MTMEDLCNEDFFIATFSLVIAGKAQVLLMPLRRLKICSNVPVNNDSVTVSQNAQYHCKFDDLRLRFSYYHILKRLPLKGLIEEKARLTEGDSN